MEPVDYFLISAIIVLAIVVARINNKLKRIASSEVNTKIRGFVLDTSAIMDGRFLKLYAAFHLDGPVYTPSKVVAELKTFADSHSAQYSTQKKAALIALDAIADLSSVSFTSEYDDVDADEQVVNVAKQVSAVVVSSDKAMLNAARVQSIDVLNPDSLQNSLLHMYAVGDELTVSVLGKIAQSRDVYAITASSELVLVHKAAKYVGKQATVRITKACSSQSIYRYEARLSS